MKISLSNVFIPGSCQRCADPGLFSQTACRAIMQELKWIHSFTISPGIFQTLQSIWPMRIWAHGWEEQGSPRVHPFSIPSDLSLSQSALQDAVLTRLLPVFVGMTAARAEWASGLDFTVGCIFNHLGVTTLSIYAPLSLTTALFLLIESELWVHQIWWDYASWHETETTSIAIAHLVS